jgi:hypothetical protein
MSEEIEGLRAAMLEAADSLRAKALHGPLEAALRVAGHLACHGEHARAAARDVLVEVAVITRLVGMSSDGLHHYRRTLAGHWLAERQRDMTPREIEVYRRAWDLARSAWINLEAE